MTEQKKTTFSLLDTDALAQSAGKIAEKTYEDGLSVPIQEAGGILSDILRIVGAPTKFLRLKIEDFIEEAINKVPEEKRIEPVLQLAAGTIEGAKYQEPGAPLYQMFNNLLACSMDKDKVQNAHPAFVRVIEHLSPDEAMFISKLNKVAGAEIRHLFLRKPLTLEDVQGLDFERTSPPFQAINDRMLEDYNYYNNYLLIDHDGSEEKLSDHLS